jgi:hypothetical protein
MALNHRAMLFHVREAREELQRIEKQLQTARKPPEAELEVLLAHAFHHLNFAWNGRRATDAQHRNLTDANFQRWRRFPRDVGIELAPKRSGRGTR